MCMPANTTYVIKEYRIHENKKEYSMEDLDDSPVLFPTNPFPIDTIPEDSFQEVINNV